MKKILILVLLNFLHAQIVIYPSADAWCDRQNPNINHGSDTILNYTYAYPYSDHVSYLKFDLDTIPQNVEIDTAFLYIYCVWGSNSGTLCFGFVSDDSWTEDSIVWSNRPSGNFFFGRGPVRIGWYQVNATDKVRNEHRGDKKISFNLEHYIAGGGSGRLNSREASSNKPYLHVEFHTGIEEPPLEIIISPNPFLATAEILIQEKGKFRVFDISGKMVDEFEIKGGSYSFGNNLPPGIYYLYNEKGRKIKTIKVK